MTRRILGLSTYPIAKPRHGGQLRVNALGLFYRSLGYEYECAAVYESPPYGPGSIGPNDIKLSYVEPRWADVPFLGDVASGFFASESPSAYEHFSRIVTRFKPDIVQLEHPFLWPLVRRLRAEGRLDGVSIVYSSHNWEGPLKESMLLRAGVPAEQAASYRTLIETMEAELAAVSSIIIAVSAEEADIYAGMATSATVLVAPNGTSRPPAAASPSRSEVLARFDGGKFMFFVGSAYPPNVEGFGELVADGGFYFLPPHKAVAVCGGASDAIFGSPEYQRFLGGNGERVHFFPDIGDEDLWSLKGAAHAFLLPIKFGGGTNLKSAEALASGKWVVSTTMALRGLDRFIGAPGVLIADTPEGFRRAIIKVMNSPPLKLGKADIEARASVYWDRAMAGSGLGEALVALDRRGAI
jgi:glycosyltransferase involved in cell wall biosynthesis